MVSSCTQALFFEQYTKLRRFSNILDSTQDNIDWLTTWKLFNIPVLDSKTFTNFKANRHHVFSSKLLFDELPVVERLKKLRPDIYDTSWLCPGCLAEHETYQHLWICPIYSPAIISIISEAKDKFSELL